MISYIANLVKRVLKGMLIFFGGFTVLVMVLAGVFGNNDRNPGNAATAAPVVASAASTSEENKKDATEVMAAAGAVGKTFDAMRDQRSMEVKDLIVVNNKSGVTACLEFNARNGFGGMNVGYSVWRLDNKGNFTFNIDKPNSWNKHCAKKDGTDRTGVAKLYLARIKQHL